jgi:hypothetical protein
MACGRVHPVSAPSLADRDPASGSSRRRGPAAGGLRLPLLILLLVAFVIAPRTALADPLKADVVASVSGGYARIAFTMSDYNPGSVRKEGNVLVISFTQPIDVSVDRLPTQAPDYIGAARRDPDGFAVRLALSRQVTVNDISTGDKYFVDLLPDTWSGPPPGLPQDVIKDLVNRAHEAEELAERERRIMGLEKLPLVPVHVATEPTFTRFVFDIPEQVSVATHREKGDLTLTFNAPLKFDLGDALAALPHSVGTIEARVKEMSATVQFNLLGKVDVRTFRDENGYAVDIVGTDTDSGAKGASETVPLQQIAQQASVALPAAPAVTAPAVTAPITPPLPSEGAKHASQQPRLSAATPAAVAVPAKSTSPVKPAAPVPAAVPALPAVAPAQPAAVPAASAKPASPGVKPVAASAPPAMAPPAPPQPAPPPAPAAQLSVPAVPPAPAPTKNPAVKKIAAPASMPSPPVAKPVAARPPKALPPTRRPGDKVLVELVQHDQDLKLSFDFPEPTAAAVFNSADTLWLVFDSKADIDLSALKDEASHIIRSAELIRAPDADILRLKLDRPHLSSVGNVGPAWTLEIGDTATAPTQPLDLDRSLLGPKRSSMVIPIEAPHGMHRISDPETGDQLLVVTAFAPARGVVHTQNFIEFRALASEQGVVVEPLADDINVALTSDRVVVSRPGGLTLSNSVQSLLRGDEPPSAMFDPKLWGYDRKGSYQQEQAQLIDAAAEAPENRRLRPRLDLARFYLARDMYPEAQGVLDVALSEQHIKPLQAETVTALVLRAVAEIMMDRPEAALKDLADPFVGDQHEAPLWRALAYAREGKWGDAHKSFKRVDAAVATLPIDLQRFALKQAMRASIEVKDFAEAVNVLNDLQTIGIPPEMQPDMSVLIGRLDEGLGRTGDALAAYREAAASQDRPAAAQSRLRETMLRYALGDLKQKEVVSALESLTTVWRGDETEIEALRFLARLYTEEGRYRDSFYVMRSAMAAHPDWDMTRQIQEEAAQTFDALFLSGKGDSMSAIEALALFYDFRELTPIGSRGDEMIRRLADRLVSVDLLDQAADLLRYQVNNRLEGAARAEVATRLAVIYLMDRKPDQAVTVLRATYSADLSTELRDQRLLLEARGLSDVGQHDLAVEVIADVKGSVATRLRSDIYWAAHKWRESAEQIELLYGDRWKQWPPLTDVERADILRAEIGYALAEDQLDLNRLRDRYGPKMAGTPDATVFQIASAPPDAGGEDFKAIAQAAAASDTLDDFLRDMKEHYPESNPISSEPTGGTPSLPGQTLAAASTDDSAPFPTLPPQTRPALPTGPDGDD